ncbi:Copper-sensing transcriptional repressor CsoR [Corynebacterium occultum]|uniref:Copper-sensing transcriptional repressor CsoR n=1 Tax=Corynebacterium occultum TaxID=2675219 RepID=A0A6B8W6G4_9CORY|nr:metal-sensitive transcriptional regulator [Corynebacterium occultum]QGU08191.1 Copper-sensing transcriptional repressor CsoR [Corynebacterium occultum]
MSTQHTPNKSDSSDVASETPPRHLQDTPTPPETGDDCHTHGYVQDKKKYLARLRRIEGQTRGIHRMIDEDQYCIDILTQISAVNSALENVALALLEDHLSHCVTHAAEEGGTVAEEKLAEAAKAIRRLVKS